VIEKLDNNEQVLLMYLAEELPAEDRLEVEQMLAVDANFREELARLEETEGLLRRGLGAMDGAAVQSSIEAAAVRRVAREIRRRTVRHAAAPERRAAGEGRRPLWWLYPVAAAAVVVLAAAVWMPRHSTPPPTRSNTPSEGFVSMTRLYQESWEADDLNDIPVVSDDALARTDAPKETGMPVDELNQLLLSADANQ
jgi:hypothetical protein